MVVGDGTGDGITNRVAYDLDCEYGFQQVSATAARRYDIIASLSNGALFLLHLLRYVGFICDTVPLITREDEGEVSFH